MDQVALGDQMDALADDIQRLKANMLDLSRGELARRVDMLSERALDLREIIE